MNKSDFAHPHTAEKDARTPPPAFLFDLYGTLADIRTDEESGRF